MSKSELEEGSAFTPRYDEHGLIPCITVNAINGDVLMFAYMNAESLELTVKTREAHYWSRSRNEIWHKGATSGAIQKVTSIKTDCDQDCLLMHVEVEKDIESTCHTSRKTCFYRELSTELNVIKLKKII